MDKSASPTTMFPIHDFSDIDVAFPAIVTPYMPSLDSMPKEFSVNVVMNSRPPRGDRPGYGPKFAWLFADMFFRGLKSLKLTPREGVDPDKAWRHLQCIARSFEPKHEHKECAFAYLGDQWFSDVEWEPAPEKTHA